MSREEGSLGVALSLFLITLAGGIAVFLAVPSNLADRPLVLNNDGAWCWFEDERAIFHDNKLLFGTIASGTSDPRRRGSVEVTSYILDERVSEVSVLRSNFEVDDHDSPALLKSPDGRVLAMYSKHGSENKMHYRFSVKQGTASGWTDELSFIPSETSEVTYSNLHYLSSENEGQGRIYNFFRGLDRTFKPSYVVSDDGGLNWRTGNVFIDVPDAFRHRPYVKYASDGKDTIHFVYTEGHPRNFDNSVYHIFYRDGKLRRSDGTEIRDLTDGLDDPREGTLVFEGDPDNVAWVSDLHLSAEGFPYVAFSVQKDSAGLPTGEGGRDHRYRYARWDGQSWQDYEIAFAGERLYPREDDYTGNIALDPSDPDTVFISTSVSPTTGYRLASGHYEIFKGQTTDSGETWKWAAVTLNSEADNLRPIVTSDGKGRSALLWLQGTYRAYTDYDLMVMGLVPAP